MTMWLIGMMGAGKSTLGERAAAAIGVAFYDTDKMIGEASGMSVEEIWQDIGEEGFRELERRAVGAVPDTDAVAAAGGGAVLDPENQAHIRTGGTVVWLRGDPELLAERVLRSETRPLLEGRSSTRMRLAEILEERAHIYSALATEVVETDNRSVDDLVAVVVGMWHR